MFRFAWCQFVHLKLITNYEYDLNETFISNELRVADIKQTLFNQTQISTQRWHTLDPTRPGQSSTITCYRGIADHECLLVIIPGGILISKTEMEGMLL